MPLDASVRLDIKFPEMLISLFSALGFNSNWVYPAKLISCASSSAVINRTPAKP